MNNISKFLKKIENERWLLLTFFIIATAVFFTSFLNLDFFWDDERFVFLNPSVLQAKSFLYFWNYKSEFFKSWPIGYSIFWILIKYAPTQSLFFYKFLNIFFHALNAFLVHRLVKTFHFPYPFFLALIFLIHPLQVESVSWIFQLLTILSFTFFILSLLLFIKFIQNKNWFMLTSSFIFFLFSLWTKSNSIFLPLFFSALLIYTHSKKRYYD